MNTADTDPDPKDENSLLKVLTAHFNSLVAARSDETILKQYSALLRFLKSQPTDFLGTHPRGRQRAEKPPALPGPTEEDLRKAPLDEVEKLVNDESTPRRQLESVAINRFSVPRGSMRSFSNRQMLIDKLRSLIGNERTHETIGAVARGEEKRTQD